MFARRGYAGATLDEVAEQAGLSKGAVYYNFESKEDLFVSLLDERIATRFAEVGEVGRSAGGDPRKAALAFFSQLERDPRWAPLFFEFVAISARTPAVRRRFVKWMRDTRERLAELIEEQLDGSSFEPALDLDDLAVLIAAMANGILLERMFDPRGVRADLLGDALALLAEASARP